MRRVKFPPIGQRVDIDGRKLWLDHAGIGSPAVVFVPGGGGMALDFLLVHERVAEVTTSVLYDRAGTGWSDDAELPRSTDEVIDELRAVLRDAVGVIPPYLLVGHSLDGAYVQRYAQRFPDEVAALLLLDPLHEDYDDYQPEYLQIALNQPTTREMPQLPEDFLPRYRNMLSDTFSAFPQPIGDMLIEKHTSPERLPTGFLEGFNALAVLNDLREGGALPDVPTIVLGATGIDAQQTLFAPAEMIREQIAGAERLYAAIAAAVQGEHRSVNDAAHPTIPMARPDAVAAAVGDLLDRAICVNLP